MGQFVGAVVNLLIYGRRRKRFDSEVVHLHHDFIADGASNYKFRVRYLPGPLRYRDIRWQIRQDGWWRAAAVPLVSTSTSTFVKVRYNQ